MHLEFDVVFMYSTCKKKNFMAAPKKTSAEPSQQTKNKRRKLSRAEVKMKLVEAVPVRDRWWTVWNSEPSGTIASMVGSPLTVGETTELVWSQKGFESLFREWIETHRGKPSLCLELFTR